MKLEVTPGLIRVVLGVGIVIAVLGVWWLWLGHVERSGTEADEEAQIVLDTLRVTRIPYEIESERLRQELERSEALRRAEVDASRAREAAAEARALQAGQTSQRLFERLALQIDSAALVIADSIEANHQEEIDAVREEAEEEAGALRLRNRSLERSLALSLARHVQRDTIESSLRAEISALEGARSGLRTALAASQAKRSVERKIGLATLVLAVAVGAATR